MNLDPNWIVGFTDGEGCFCVSIVDHGGMKYDKQVQIEFSVVQHVIDINVLHGVKNFFKCGTVKRNHGDRWMWVVKDLNSIVTIIIPFFETHPLKTKKRQEFITFREIVLKMVKGEHLTPEGLYKIDQMHKTLRVLTEEQRVLKDAATERRVAKRAAKKEQESQ